MRTHRRGLAWLLALLTVAAAGAAVARWGLSTVRIDPSPTLLRYALLVEPLVAAWFLALLLFIGLTTARATLRRSGRPTRSLAPLQTAAIVVVLVVLVAGAVGDFSSTLISLGLVGFGLTIALQRPILAVAGWATIFFGGMFREGDRIHVGDLAGDVLAVNLFTTRLWEMGQPESATPGRPTGRVRIVSNAVFLEQPVANATSDTPTVFDEFVVTVSFESDLALAKRLLHRVGEEVLDPAHHERLSRTYRRLTQGLSMEAVFPDKPVLLMESMPSWMELRLRYLVDARGAATVRARLTEAWQAATEEHPDGILTVYPRVQPQPIGASGRPVEA